MLNYLIIKLIIPYFALLLIKRKIMRKGRQVNKIETFKVSEESKPIIEVAMKQMSKSEFYNGLIETFGNAYILNNTKTE
jgi:hypothetical protein